MRRAAGASQQIFDRVIGDQSTGAKVPTATFSGNFVSGTKFPLLPRQSILIFNASTQVYVKEAPGTGIFLQALNLYIQFYSGAGTALTGPVIVLAAKAWGAQSLTVNGGLVNGASTGMGCSVDGDPVMELASNMLFTGTTITGGASAAFFSIDAAFDCYNGSGGDLTPYAIVTSLHSQVER